MSDCTYRPCLFCLRIADQEPGIVSRTREDKYGHFNYLYMNYKSKMQDDVFLC